MEWKILDTGSASAAENMRLDADLLENLENDAIIHFYDWAGDSATYGYFTKPQDFFNEEGVRRRGLTLARRPTGGGIVFHLWDLAFSVLVPASSPVFSLGTLENYQFVNEAVLKAVQEFLGERPELTPVDFEAKCDDLKWFCMAGPTKYDVVLHGRKVAGAAQRKTKKGFLHQGTIALVMPPEDYLDDVLKNSAVKEAILRSTYPLIQHPSQLADARSRLKQLLTKYLREKENVTAKT